MVGRTARDIERALLRKGFRFSDSHHRYLSLYVDEVPVRVRTFLSHGVREYGDPLLAQVAKHLHLSKSELLLLIDCDLSAEDYVRLLRSRGVDL